jgi:hypothetical protein
MTKKYHINSKGEPGICRAKNSCPFGDMETEHYSSVDEARGVYEQEMNNYFTPNVEKLLREEMKKLDISENKINEVLITAKEWGTKNKKISKKISKKNTVNGKTVMERCPGAGAYARDLAGNPGGSCPGCGRWTTRLTAAGTIRSHKRPKKN